MGRINSNCLFKAFLAAASSYQSNRDVSGGNEDGLRLESGDIYVAIWASVCPRFKGDI